MELVFCNKKENKSLSNRDKCCKYSFVDVYIFLSLLFIFIYLLL